MLQFNSPIEIIKNIKKVCKDLMFGHAINILLEAGSILFSFQVNVSYGEEEVAISEYPLSAALTCAKLCSGFEECWGVT